MIHFGQSHSPLWQRAMLLPFAVSFAAALAFAFWLFCRLRLFVLFCFAYFCAFLLHTNFVHSSHVIKTNIVYSSAWCKCSLRYEHTFFFAFFFCVQERDCFTQSAHSALNLTGLIFTRFSLRFACTYRCMHAFIFELLSVCIWRSCGDKLSGSVQNTHRH